MSNSSRPQTVLLIGNGFLAQYCRESLSCNQLILVNRSEAGQQANRPYAAHEVPVVADITNQDQLAVITEAIGTQVCDLIFMVPPSIFTDQNVSALLQPMLRALSEINCRRSIVVSSSGVYADNSQEEIEVSSPTPAASKRVARLLAVEQEMRTLPAETVVVRLVGLYSENRIIGARQLRAGQAIAGKGTSWLNLIHAEDAAKVIERLLDLSSPPHTLLISDGRPLQREDYYRSVANCLNATLDFDGGPLKRGGGYKVDSSASWASCGLSPVHTDARVVVRMALNRG